ncbi:MAG TPA: DnaJ C-terminal domain-containing protein [Kofleriaceae bacterium]|jgi:DnaJ-class molecular chaperone|nr:DnaJ C-terminal domain-containing protein [Kofleriaceae bacterium]
MADLYQTLGVAKTADADSIRKAYRKLARKYHPDVNPGDTKAEDSFKKVSAAYEVLSDPKRRAAYDEFGEAATADSFDADKARSYRQWQQTREQRSSRFDEGPVEFDFGDLFGRARGPSQGPDLLARVQMDLRQAIEGGEVSLDLPGQGSIRVRIPPGADNGSTIRVPGKGAPGASGGPPGDLVIETEVRPHPLLRREGLDLYLTVPITLDEAYNGASIEVPTLDGPVLLKVPPRTQGGSKLRLRAKGVARRDATGDLIVVLDLRMPDRPDDALAAALHASASAYSAPVRGEMSL